MTSISTIPATLSDLSGSYVLDPGHTRIGFVARHAMVTKVRGAFNEFEGSAVLDGTDLSKSTGQLTIQAASIDTRNEQRDAHLRSNDFLAMAEYPQVTFVATDVRQSGPTSLELTGDLTIRGVTNSVTIPFEFEGAATDPYGNLRVGFEGSDGHQPQGLRHHLEHRTRDRRRPGQRQDHPRVRGLRDQDRLTLTNPPGVVGRSVTSGRPRP